MGQMNRTLFSLSLYLMVPYKKYGLLHKTYIRITETIRKNSNNMLFISAFFKLKFIHFFFFNGKRTRNNK